MNTVYPVHFTYKMQTASITLSSSVEAELRKKLCGQEVEQGGALGIENGVVSRYYHDTQARCDCNLFQPSPLLNVLLVVWKQEGIAFAGLIHSHPAEWPELSEGDLDYVRKLLRSNPELPAVLMGIMAGDRLLFYGFERDYLTTPQTYRETVR